MAVTPKGIRMINENVVQLGRTFIYTDPSQADWVNIPDGSLYIHPETGIVQVKIAGESDWIPLPEGLANDGTLVISRDTALHTEVFTILEIDEENHTFRYQDAYGNIQEKTKDENGFVFQLADGRFYLPGRHHLTVILDDVLERSVDSGGIEELDEHRFRLKEDVPVGTEVTVRYFQWVRIGNPYPRIYETNPDLPADMNGDPETAQTGDLFLDWNAEVDGLPDLYSDALTHPEIDWNLIVNTPSTLDGYRIIDAASKHHTHLLEDITGLQETIQGHINNLNLTDARTLKGHEPDESLTGRAGTVAIYGSGGKLPVNVLPAGSRFEVGMIIDWYGSSTSAPKGWAICDGRIANGIKTPDLRGKFIIGGGTSGTYIGSTRTSNSAAPVKSGGAASITIKKANLPPHDHTHTHKHKHSRGTMNITGALSGSGNSNNKDTNERPTYTGAFYKIRTGTGGVPVDYEGTKGDYVGFDASKKWSGYTSEDATKNSASTNSADFKSTAISILPPYVALFKIMYVGV